MAAFYCASPGQGFRARITAGGYTLEGPSGGAPVVMSLEQVAGMPLPAPKAVAHSGARLRYDFGAFSVEYLHGAGGLRQNFLLHQQLRPNPEVCIRIGSAYAPRLHAAGALELTDRATGHTVLSYADLNVWDATGRRLPAHFALDGDRLRIVVHDEGAQYPVTIDPLNTTPEWETTADGLLSGLLSSTAINGALYGYKVIAAGDVNADGYEDVAISAPAIADIFTGTGQLAGVGAVFVFLGSTAGVSATPAHILQSSTVVSGGLFGFSMDGGDLNADGFSDLVISAPLDQVTVALGGGGTVSSTVGRVYVYSGAALNAVTPAPLLSVTLNNSVIRAVNASVNALFGFSVSILDDLNADGIQEIAVGAPTYARIGADFFGGDVLEAQTGGAFVYRSNGSFAYPATPVNLLPPSTSLLGLVSLNDLSGLLMGFSVDGAGDYNADGFPDLVVGMPAGVNLGSLGLGALLSGKVLSGSAGVYYGTATSIGTTQGASLQPGPAGLLGNAANLFGYAVRGLVDSSGQRSGQVAVGAPLGGTVANALGLSITTGSVALFVATPGASGDRPPVQTLESPQPSSLLTVLGTFNASPLYGAAIDNAFDADCDGIGDLIVGEPLGSALTVAQLQANALGGSVYVYKGNGDGTFVTTPAFTSKATYGGAFSSINAVSLYGTSVAGVPGNAANASTARLVTGAPTRALDFVPGLLALGSTVTTIFNVAAGDNGPGKAFIVDAGLCGAALPLTLIRFDATAQANTVKLDWETANEQAIRQFVVERSADGAGWQTMGAVQAAGGGRYAFTDARPLAGLGYYRLRIEEWAGAPGYSEVRSVRMDEALRSELFASPNPASGGTFITLPDAGAWAVELISATGSVVLRTALSGDAGSRHAVSLAGVVAGVYTVQMSSGAAVRRQVLSVR